MKKLFIYASVLGLVTSIVYFLYKEEKSNHVTYKAVDEKEDFEDSFQQKDIAQNASVADKIHQSKYEIANDVYERHKKASSVMKDAYANIMENFVDNFTDEKDDNKKVDIDIESVSLIKRIDSISEKLDDLLK